MNGTDLGNWTGNGTGDDAWPDSNQFELPLWHQLAWTMLFVPMIVVATGGNLIVIWIVMTNKRMRNVTNYFLVNLSIADAMVSTLNVSVNFSYMLTSNWMFGTAYCKFSQFVAVLSICASVFTLMAISIDRYIAIIHPLRPRLGRKTTLVIAISIWVLGMILSIPNLIFFTTYTEQFPNGKQRVICYAEWPDGITTESFQEYLISPPFIVNILLNVADVERPSTTELALCDGQIEGGDVVANLGPVERAQQLQTYVYEDISVMGRTRESKYFDVQTRKVKQILDVARETADDRMGRQLRMAEERVRSSSRAEYEIKRSEFVAEAKEKFHKALISVRADVAVRCEEKIKQHAIDAVRTTSANVDKSLAALAERLRREFEYFKEHNVTEFEDYYGQLLASYRGRFENDFGVLARRHERKYEKAKKSWAREMDGALSDDRRRWRPSENPKTIVASREQVEEPAPSSLRRREEETAAGRLEKQIDEKLERLDAADRRARFFKGKIKTVLNNYASLVSSRENHPRAGVCCAPDRGELFRKYLHVPAGAGRTTTIPDDALRNCHV